MFSLRLETISRFTGSILLIALGILLSLFLVTLSGGAVPITSWATNPGFMRDSSLNYFSVEPKMQPSINGNRYFTLAPQQPAVLQPTINGRLYLTPASQQPAVLQTTTWQTAMIKTWSLVATTCVVFTGLLYLLLRRVHFGMSEEIFP
jgi:hypothetical protein